MAHRKKRNSQRKIEHTRRKAFKEAKERFIIFCEGKNTEPEYFKAFRVLTACVKTIHINKGDALGLVNEAILQKGVNEDYDQYWVVFDKDETSDERFNKAVELAETNRIDVAYSNQAFEYWFLLHFKRYEGNLDRIAYAGLLENHLGCKYEKRLKMSKKMYEILLPNQPMAIENAEKVYNTYGEPRNPALEESTTTVFKLVRELNKYI